MELESLLKVCSEAHASDLHLSPGHPPIMRKHGDLLRMEGPLLNAAELDQDLLTLIPGHLRLQFNAEQSCDFRLTSANIASRVHIYSQLQGLSAAIRIIPNSIPELSTLNLPQIVYQLADKQQGIILIAGASGSGKSTTLASIISHINKIRRCHILTLEDPVEFTYISEYALISQREIHYEHPSFNVALKSALREDPDIIMIGEMRDAATMSLAIQAADTGHLVLSTLHARDTSDAIFRIISTFPYDSQACISQQLSMSLQAIIAQKLVKTLKHTGLTLTHEVLIATHAIRNLIRENRIAHIASILQTGKHAGMHTFTQDIEAKSRAGIIDAPYAETLKNLLDNPCLP